jgi:hypothetical protein
MVRLLFDLSSNDRLTLLFAIRKEENQRLTKLAEKIKATIAMCADTENNSFAIWESNESAK